MKKIGWIGLGNMGTPMAKNLEKAGFPLSVYNRSADKTVAFSDTGATVCKSIRELVDNSDIIFTMVSNDAAVQSVYGEILFSDALEGKLFIDMSTISQQLSETIAQRIKQAKASFLDAPVAGSIKPAADGTLVIMAGGDEKDVEAAMPYFEKLGRLTKHLGNNGKGIAAKLSVNYFLSLIFMGLGEAVLIAEEKGISRSTILEIINESASGSGATKVKTPLLIKDEYPPAFALSLMLKDILLVQNSGVDLPFTPVLVDTYRKAQKAGYGEQDVMAIIRYLKEDF